MRETFKRYSFDKLLLVSTTALMILGIIMVFSSSAVLAGEKYRQSFYFLTHQIIAVILGSFLMLLIACIRNPFFTLTKLVYVATGATFLLLLLSLAMPPVAGSHRWVQLFGARFQPSELAKIVLVLFLANYCSRRADVLNHWKTLLPPLAVIMSFTLAILAEPDYSTAIFIFFISTIILYLGGLKLRYFIIPGLIALIIFGLFLISADYRVNRLHSFLSPQKDPLGKAFQIRQSKLAVGAGGLLGVSLGSSTQKLYFLPCAHTDFIFAIIGEEIGLAGTMLTVSLFLVFLFRGLRIADRASSHNYRLIAYGLTLVIIIQSLLNVSVVLGLGPVTGVPLPFISFGRSALVCDLIAVGLLLNISQRKNEANSTL